MNTVQLSEKNGHIENIHEETLQHSPGDYRKGPTDSNFIATLRVIHTLHKKRPAPSDKIGCESIYTVSDKGLEVIK